MNELKRLYLLCRQCDNLPAYKAIKQVRIWIAEIAITSIIKEVNDLPPIVV